MEVLSDVYCEHQEQSHAKQQAAEKAANKAAERSAKKTTAVIKAVIDKLWELGYGLSENEADDDTQFPMDGV